MKSTIQDETLAGKASFKIWAVTFGERVKIYQADNGILSEQLLDQQLRMPPTIL